MLCWIKQAAPVGAGAAFVPTSIVESWVGEYRTLWRLIFGGEVVWIVLDVGLRRGFAWVWGLDRRSSGSLAARLARPGSPGGYEGDGAGPVAGGGVEAIESGEHGAGHVAGLEQARAEFLDGLEPVFRPGGLSRVEGGCAFGAYARETGCGEESGHGAADEVVDADGVRPLEPGLPEGL